MVERLLRRDGDRVAALPPAVLVGGVRTTTVPFDLRAWRARMRLTQAQAAQALGLSLSGYCESEYRAADRKGHPVVKTVALLAQALERETKERA
jgi:DNA-binding XRE family transcriptional regulator